ncbi:uncharacterized protein LOC111518789 [Drosophila willistoni]|uniref:uncharacterized protein LOC111518789 n=1 Tax=Drosophila willistoni TaxID=7260 RepID=UPI001F071AD9|nr:uncharacterized protein LOC111518789 [Drosophila willistoni]
MNKDLLKNQQDYLTNSREHRLMFSIAKSMLFLASHIECSDQLWLTLFLSSNQFNITCMYEMVLAKSLRDPEVLLKRLKSIRTLNENQRVSLLSVVHMFLYFNWDSIPPNEVNKIVSFLHLSLHKGQNRELSEITELILISLILENQKSRYYKPIVEALYESLKRLTLDQKKSLPPHIQARLFLPELHSATYLNFGLYISNLEPTNLSNTDRFRMLRIRQVIKTVLEIEKGQEIIANVNLGTPNKSTTNSNPKPQPVQQNRSAISNGNLFVVSPCIDNVNSLNGLIQNCVSFGVRTLVLSDSINLSAETRKDLEILQINPELFAKYLRGKKIENFSIVGIENIDKNEYLNECSPTENTIVVLGNDRHGTPDNLKHLLDYTVQLPLKDVRSLQHLPIFMYSKKT